MPMLDRLCRFYQRQFPEQLSEAGELVALHAHDDKSAYLDKYFEHELEKGKRSIERFLSWNREWIGSRVLDFGCGAGGLTFALRERAASAAGVDLEEYKLAFARREAAKRGVDGIEFVGYPGERLPFADSSFDTVFCVDVLEHVPKPDLALGEMRRVLKPGGLLLLSFGPPWGHPHGKHTWTRLPGWWSHLIFPQAVCMRVIGLPANCTWEALGLHRLTVSKFDRHIRRSGFQQLHRHDNIRSPLGPLKSVPWLRELFVSEVGGVYRNPH